LGVIKEEGEEDRSSTTTLSNREVSYSGIASKKRKKCGKSSKLSYTCTGYWREDHGQPLFGVCVNTHIADPNQPVVFATVGFNRVSIYESVKGEGVRLVQCYADPDSEENLYTCAWSYDDETKRPVLAAAGSRGIIRLFSPASMTCIRNFVGHGNAINELKFHPTDPNLLLSASRDHALRVWNVKTEANVVIFGGVEGHRDEVLSADFDMNGERIVSCGMDHSLKVWDFNTQQIKDAIKLSYQTDVGAKKSFPTVLCHFPVHSTRDIHRNYVDCCRWYGDFVFSKSCENSIVCWKPGQLDPRNEKTGENDESTVIHKLDLKDCDIWFIRFSMDTSGKYLALGNRTGKVYAWNLDVEDPSEIRSTVLSHPKCVSTIRQTSMSRDGRVLLSVCDDGTLWKWEMV